MSEVQSLTVTAMTLTELAVATPQSARKQRQGPGGKMLTYVDARYVMGVLDSEVGPSNWQNEFIIGAGGKVGCRIGIHVEDRGWVWKGDGAGETDVEGQKGSFSDAFKRAAVQWGIARDLYGEAPSAPVQQAAPVERPALPPQNAVAGAPRSVPYQNKDDDGLGACPAGHGSWAVKPGGFSQRTNKNYDAFYACSGKTDNGGYCNEKPSKAWVAAHPIGELPF